ncbi:hypothetical protein RUM43_000709 [Polyplax serrata]|uniref:Uncharacterized protein n=1 Tax=Polyplax serrata TaxID=468196 RepID=A0AAN8XSP9_POLSC
MLREDDQLARLQSERQIINEGTAIWRNKRKLETLLEAEEKKLQWNMLTSYNPWGKPGHGAPMPGALRKTKWIFENPNEEINPHSVTTLGRPGHGAPIRTPTGKPLALIRSDPLLRFQMHNLSRAAVENDLRYKSTPHDKENYRRELDAIVCQKKKADRLESENVNSNAAEKKGWTNDVVFKKMERDRDEKNEREQFFEISGGGVELVPLLAKHRMVTKCPLSTTDITKMSRLCKPESLGDRRNVNPGHQLTKQGSTPPEYLKQLCYQVEEKERQKLVGLTSIEFLFCVTLQEREEETVQSNRHFETWQGFWGRPGHGAPKALSQREKLDVILYKMPSKRIINKKQQ